MAEVSAEVLSNSERLVGDHSYARIGLGGLMLHEVQQLRGYLDSVWGLSEEELADSVVPAYLGGAVLGSQLPEAANEYRTVPRFTNSKELWMERVRPELKDGEEAELVGKRVNVADLQTMVDMLVGPGDADVISLSIEERRITQAEEDSLQAEAS